MITSSIQLRGQKILEKKINKLSEPEKIFDKDYKRAARQSVRELVEGTLGKTKAKTGNTARGWTNPRKKGDSYYIVKNAVLTSDKKHLIVDIIDKGRREVFPVKAKRLYIPLSEEGRGKKIGGKIPKNFVYGEDYILAFKAKAFKGRPFIDKEIKIRSREITRAIIKTIRGLT
ncbi:MAG: hypothetical protein ACFFE4_00470 [Candidatus Thorarchaeota archaeon]